MGGVFSGSDRQSSVSANAARASADEAARSAELAEEWAVGPDPDDGTPGEENNAKYWAGIAENATEITGGFGIDVTSSEVSIDAADGTMGQFLSTDGEGNLSFATAADTEALSDLTDVTLTDLNNTQVLRFNGTIWVNSDESEHGITAGAGLELNNNVISVLDEGIDTAQLADGSVTTAKISDGDVTRAKITDLAIDADKLSVAGTNGQILSTNSSGDLTWVDADGNTAYTASEGLVLVSDDFQIATDGVTTVKIVDDAVTSAKILDDNVTADELNVTGDGTSGQILSSDGDGSFTWIDNDGGTDTTYTAGTGLDLTGTVFSVADQGIDTTQIAGEAVGEGQLNSTNSPTEAGQLLSANLDGTFTWVAADGNTAYTAGTGLTLASDEFSITAGGVTATEIADNTVGADELNVTGDGTNGQFLSSDGDGTFTWRAGSTTLQGLTDTNIPATITDRRLLEFEPSDGTWNATSISDILRISDMFDVHEDTPLDNQFLRYDSSNANGPGWVNETVTIPANLSFTTPLSRSGNTVSISSGGITNALLANDAVNDSKLNASNAGTAGQLLSADGDGTFTWVDADGNTAYTASEGLTLVSDDFQIAADGVTNDKLADNSVRTENIVNGTILGADISNGAVDTAQMADDAVTAAKIADGTITAAQVANNTLTAVQLATDSVTSFKIQDGAVIASKIPDGSITEPKLSVTNAGEDGQILSRAGASFTWIDDAGGTDTTYTADETTLNLTGTVFSVADQGIDTTQIATNAVTGTQISAGAVDTSELVDLAVETAKLSDGAVTNDKLGTGAVNTSKIFDGAITAAKLGTGSVTEVKLGDDSVTTDKIVDGNVTNAKVATDIPLNKLMDVNTTGALNGQVLTFNGTNWLPMTPSGGGNTDNSRLGIALDTASLNEGDVARTVAITLSIVDGLTDETISGQSVTVTDPTGHTINVDGSGNAFTFSASGMNVGNYVIRASATFTISGNTSVHTSSATLRVIATPADNINYYQQITATAPTAVADMTDNGVFNSPEDVTFTSEQASDNSAKAYIALPTRTDGYTFRVGLFIASELTSSVIGEFTLYRVNDEDFDNSLPAATIITITEA